MTNTDRLQATVNKAFGDDTTILRSNNSYVLVRYSKGGSVEFVTLRHDFDSMTGGHYFIAWFTSADDYNSAEYKNARDNAISDYENRI